MLTVISALGCMRIYLSHNHLGDWRQGLLAFRQRYFGFEAITIC